LQAKYYGFKGFRFRGSGFKGSRFRGLGFKGSRFRASGFRVQRFRGSRLSVIAGCGAASQIEKEILKKRIPACHA